MTTPDLFFSYYPYPVTARAKTHDTIIRPVSSIVRDRRAEEAASAASAGANVVSGAKRRKTQKNEGYTKQQQALALEAAEKRAIRGLRPAGVDMGREADELSEEERVMDDDRDNLNLFGHRFLLPFGRRQTQAETEALPQSPTPSQDQDERRQEDQMMNGLGSSPPPMGGEMEDDGAEGGERDLDASLVDLDASLEDMDAVGEDGELDED